MRARHWILLLGLLSACTEMRVTRYRDMLEPRIGSSRKIDVDRLLGAPAYCKQGEAYELCEYRTAKGRNEPVPGHLRQGEGLGPDLSPYDQFDVLHLYFDSFGVLKEWEPVVIRP